MHVNAIFWGLFLYSVGWFICNTASGRLDEIFFYLMAEESVFKGESLIIIMLLQVFSCRIFYSRILDVVTGLERSVYFKWTLLQSN